MDLSIPAMDLFLSSSNCSTVRFANLYYRSPAPLRRRTFAVRSTALPFPNHKAKYFRELQAAVDVVERACRLCLDVKSSLSAKSDGRIVEKNDQTPVTVADFGVQALVSLELGKLFPSIPLVAEEDSAFVRSNNLVEPVVNAVTGCSSSIDKSWTEADVLEAIDRGGKDAFVFCTKPATYWVLDPIDGTRGFLKGTEALYVVGLALVVDGEIVLAVMGCPNWKEDLRNKSISEVQGYKNILSESGIVMVAHLGCGTWARRLIFERQDTINVPHSWTRCFVDHYSLVHEARFCIPESQTWDSLPLSALFSATTDANSIGDNQILLLPQCCGSLCKYLMVASGRASVFILRTRDEKTIKAWDHAAGIICVHEAGGQKFCQMDGATFQWLIEH
nr:putative PAP-specific phosphatase, mitochondrial isoform X3 [Ziziphus jujuba var. spinosa]